jgi:hypothetical protein
MSADMTTPTKTISKPEDIQPALQWAFSLISKGLVAGAVVISLGRESRSIDQNSRLWATLKDVSDQVNWYGQMLSPDDWKHVFSAALEKQKLVPGIDGGFVMCGISTSKMSKQKFSDLLEIINAFGAEQGVKWSDPALEAFAEYITHA